MSNILGTIENKISVDNSPKFFEKPLNKLTFAIDFDGTIVEDKFPYIGNPMPGAIEALNKLQSAGVKLILWTCRYGERLKDAIAYCSRNGIIFSDVNVNQNCGFDAKSPKIFADAYLDDRSFPSFTSIGWDNFIKLIETHYNVKFE